MTDIRMVLTLIPLPRLRLERQMGSGEDCQRPQGSSPWNICAKTHYSHVKRCKREFRSRTSVALRPKDEAARGVFLFGYFGAKVAVKQRALGGHAPCGYGQAK
jgi:hypothetical protein